MPGSSGGLITPNNLWAVFIGINEYADPQWGKLPFCENDASELAALFVDPKRGGYQSSNIRILVAGSSDPLLPTRNNIIGSTYHLANAATDADTIVFGFFGHGLEAGGTSYLLPLDSVSSSISDTAISLRWIQDTLQQSRARVKLLIFDACHSGSLKGRSGSVPMSVQMATALEDIAGTEGWVVLSSCKQDELSYDFTEKRHGVFTHFLLEALNGAADADNDGVITARDAATYTISLTKAWAFKAGVSQNPEFKCALTGPDIVLIDRTKRRFPKRNRELLPIIAVMGTKGGVGKSVFVSLAAQLLAASGGDVAIIDLDLAASGTTLAAESEYPHTKPRSTLTAFDHVARRATNIGPYSRGHSEELWDVTPPFLITIGGGHIWLLPAREPANPGQSFDVVANVLPPKQRGEKLAAVVDEQIDRICERYPNVRAILVDCGAERNPIYGAAFSKAEKGYILFGPNPEYFGEVKAVRDELLQMFRSINPSNIHAVANNVMSIADEERCRSGISPIAMMAAIPSDPLLRRAQAENRVVHIDLGHEIVSKVICDALLRVSTDRRASMIQPEHVGCIPIVSLFVMGGGLDELSRKLKIKSNLTASIAVLAGVTLLLLLAGLVLTRSAESRGPFALHNLLLIGLMPTLASVSTAVWYVWGLRSRRNLLSELGRLSAGSPIDVFPAVLKQMRYLGERDRRLVRQIQKWIERRQQHERIAR